MFYTNVQVARNKILARYVDDDGSRGTETFEFEPTLYIPSNKKESDWKTLEGLPLVPFHPGGIKDSREFIKTYNGVEGVEVFGLSRFQYQFINEKFPNAFDKWDISKIRIFNIDIEVGSEDGFPHPEKASEEITAITLKDSKTGLFQVWGCGEFYINKCKYLDKKLQEKIVYNKCKNEMELIVKFIQYWRENMPDVVTGWNIRFFDIPYIVNRIKRLSGNDSYKTLSPWKVVSEEVVTKFGKPHKYYTILGVSSLDYLEIFRKNQVSNHENYRLDYIGHVILKEKKLDYSEAGTLHKLYKTNFQKFIEYNIQDVNLVDRLDDKLGYLGLTFTIAYSAGCNFDDVHSQVRIWDCIIHNELFKRKIAIPQMGRSNFKRPYIGGHVKEPKPGFYKWVVSFDLASLYPSLIRQYNISPDTIQDSFVDIFGMDLEVHLKNLINKEMDNSYAKSNDISLAANGTGYTKSFQGVLPYLMEKYYNERVVFKKEMIKWEKLLEKEKKEGITKEREIELEKNISRAFVNQYARKIMLNSAYGAIGNEYFRFYDVRQAEAVTSSGQLSIRWIEKRVNLYVNKILKTKDVDYIIAVDTDSIYIDFSSLVGKVFNNDGEENTTKIVNFLDKISEEKIAPVITKGYMELHGHMNAYEQQMFMEREVIADKGIWTAKKRYILRVHDSEGVRYETPKLKIMGIESVRSSTPEVCRDKIKNCLELIFESDEDTVINFIDEFREEFYKLPAEDVSFPRGVNEMSKWEEKGLRLYKKGTPIHVKGSILYNDYLKQYKLENDYEKISDSTKIKFFYLKKHNPIHDTVFSYPNVLPKEFGLEKYIDYEMQFEKTFIQPIQTILHVIGWDTEHKSSLEGFF